jgi:hypothetical protein
VAGCRTIDSDSRHLDPGTGGVQQWADGLAKVLSSLNENTAAYFKVEEQCTGRTWMVRQFQQPWTSKNSCQYPGI